MPESTTFPIVIRKATSQDMSPLWAIFRQIAAEGQTYVQSESISEAEFVEYWTGRGGEQWVAELQGEVVGGYTLRANHPGRGSHVATASYIVSPARQGLGLGRKLGEHSIAQARTESYKAMQFNFVVSTNVRAVALWKKLDFEVVGVLPEAFQHKDRGPVDALVMFRRL